MLGRLPVDVSSLLPPESAGPSLCRLLLFVAAASTDIATDTAAAAHSSDSVRLQ